MPVPQSTYGLVPATLALANALVESMMHPAVIVGDDSIIVAANANWLYLFDDDRERGLRQTIANCARHIDGLDGLRDQLRNSTADEGALSLVLVSSTHRAQRGFIARWRRLSRKEDSQGQLSLVLLEDHEDARKLSAKLHTQQVRINELLVRQTILEEKQRRLLGSALHDGVLQTMCCARQHLADDQSLHGNVEEAVTLIDKAIADVRDLAFALSPPILEDLGLLPALQWLIDDTNQRYQIDASLVDDGQEPALASDARTIAFRAVRELVLNAVKHAAGSQVVISSLVNHRACYLTVSDTGPGFAYNRMTTTPDGRPLYGLLSVEQQILALGGAFELVSTPGKGTQAVLILPLAVDAQRETASVDHA